MCLSISSSSNNSSINAHTSFSLRSQIHHSGLHWAAGTGTAPWQPLCTNLPSTAALAAFSGCKILSRLIQRLHIFTLAVPQGPLSALVVTSLLPNNTPCRWIQHTNTPSQLQHCSSSLLPSLGREKRQPCPRCWCSGWQSIKKRNQSKICPKKVQQGRLPQAEAMLEWMRRNHWIV